tara:strand:- start:358378 stop:359358 length:981 start_codon:yes stop_codon:yes gene_type:complete
LRNRKFIDLFAGIGGFRQGLEAKNYDCVFSSEWGKLANEIYFKNFQDRPFGDITKIPANSIPKHDILCAGFPCQAFSVAGKRLGFEDTRGTLFFDVARIAKVHTPKVLLLENVKNFASHDGGRTLKVVYKTLEEIGYSVFHKVLRSSDFGAPQARERIYIVAIYNFKGTFEFPKKMTKHLIINDILLDLSNQEFKELQITRPDIVFTKKENEVIDPLRPLQIGKINKGGQGERIYSRYASGITLSAYGGGAAAKTGAYKIGRRIRKLHPIEALRLQGFSDNFILPESPNQAYHLLGNSVTVNIVKALKRELEKQVFSSMPKEISIN